MNFNKLFKDIKDIKIQGSEHIAIAAINSINEKDFSEKKLLKLRPNEPTLLNGVKYAKKFDKELSLKHFKEAKQKINYLGYKKVKNIVFTHCHSSTVINMLIYAKLKGKKFEVYNTETRPLFQGRKTAKELAKAKIKVTEFVDAAAQEAIKKSKVIFLGADAITNKGDVINKIGSGMISIIAKKHKVPLYICTDSWKFDPRTIKGFKTIEERPEKEVWKENYKLIKERNPAFELIENKYISGIISDLGILKPKQFVKKVKEANPWMIKP